MLRLCTRRRRGRLLERSPLRGARDPALALEVACHGAAETRGTRGAHAVYGVHTRWYRRCCCSLLLVVVGIDKRAHTRKHTHTHTNAHVRNGLYLGRAPRMRWMRTGCGLSFSAASTALQTSMPSASNIGASLPARGRPSPPLKGCNLKKKKKKKKKKNTAGHEMYVCLCLCLCLCLGLCLCVFGCVRQPLSTSLYLSLGR